MLAYILALAVGFGSLSLYLSAFFLPEIYRKYDLIWSGVGLFYGLVLWVCAGRITGGVLLGQMASVALLGWLGWQTLSLRFAQTSKEQRITPPVSANSLQEVVQYKGGQIRQSFQDGSWRIHLSNFLDQLPAQAGDLARAVQGWIEALIGTTLGSLLQPQGLSSEAPPAPASVKPTGERVDTSDRSTPSSPLPANGSRPTTPVPTKTQRSTVFVESQPLADPKAEFSAEWDDLELEIHPELETVDGTSFDPISHLHERVDPKPDAPGRSVSENQDAQ